MSCAFDFLLYYWFRCFLHRVMVIFRQQKNFGPNVRYCVLDIMKNNLQNINHTSKICFMFVNFSYIVSFVVKSSSRGKNPWKAAPANPRMSLFENCFKSLSDTVRWWEMSCAFDFLRNYWFRCFPRRVMVILLQQKSSATMSYDILRFVGVMKEAALEGWPGDKLRSLKHP